MGLHATQYYSLLGCDAVQSGRNVPALWRNLLPLRQIIRRRISEDGNLLLFCTRLTSDFADELS
jgi:hypothetical protein